MTVPTVSAAEANERHQAGECLIDVREDDEWARAHIPGAIHMPLSRFTQFISEIPKDAPLLIHCAVGGRSAQVTGWLNQQGYAAFNVAGGIQSWAAEGLPLEP
jgi:rhodanese-related sulfurtransferase